MLDEILDYVPEASIGNRKGYIINTNKMINVLLVINKMN
jgi:hypothetical protein